MQVGNQPWHKKGEVVTINRMPERGGEKGLARRQSPGEKPTRCNKEGGAKSKGVNSTSSSVRAGRRENAPGSGALASGMVQLSNSSSKPSVEALQVSQSSAWLMQGGSGSLSLSTSSLNTLWSSPWRATICDRPTERHPTQKQRHGRQADTPLAFTHMHAISESAYPRARGGRARLRVDGRQPTQQKKLTARKKKWARPRSAAMTWRRHRTRYLSPVSPP